MRWITGEARSYIAKIPNLNLCADDERVLDYINRAQEYIIVHSKGQVLHQRIALCATNNCIVWPRQVASVTDIALCSEVIPLRNQWYEFLPDGAGPYVGQQSCGVAGHDRGETSTFSDITPGSITKKLKLYLDLAEDTGKYLYAYGPNQNGVNIRTDMDGKIREGERIPLVNAQLSANFFQVLQRVRKDRTKGRVMVYEVDTVTAVEKPLAIYDPDEENPVYQKTLLRGAGCSTSCGTRTVVAMVKLEFIPATHDDDMLIVGSRTALWFMVMALLKFENNREAEGQGLANLAMAEMGFYRDHKSPKEQIAITIRAQGATRYNGKLVGRML